MQLPDELFGKKGYDMCRMSPYYSLFGYCNKYSFFRYLDSVDFEFRSKRKEKIVKRTGKEYYLPARELIGLLLEKQKGNAEVETAFVNRQKEIFDSRVFQFLTTEKKTTYRHHLYNHRIEVKGPFYDYSLNTGALADEIGLCHYECFKIAQQKYPKVGFAYFHFRSSDHIPIFCFDSTEARIRWYFIDLMDAVGQKISLTQKQTLMLRAYRMSVKEMLDYQDGIDQKNEKKVKRRRKTEEEMLKIAYREASRLFHPDVNGHPEANAIMQQVNLFYGQKNHHAIRNLINIKTHSV
jgi:hypothetical protein